MCKWFALGAREEKCGRCINNCIDTEMKYEINKKLKKKKITFHCGHKKTTTNAKTAFLIVTSCLSFNSYFLSLRHVITIINNISTFPPPYEIERRWLVSITINNQFVYDHNSTNPENTSIHRWREKTQTNKNKTNTTPSCSGPIPSQRIWGNLVSGPRDQNGFVLFPSF